MIKDKQCLSATMSLPSSAATRNGSIKIATSRNEKNRKDSFKVSTSRPSNQDLKNIGLLIRENHFDYDSIPRDKTPKHWRSLNQDYLQYVLNALFNGGLVNKISFNTFVGNYFIINFPNIIICGLVG